MKSARLDLVMARPSDSPARAACATTAITMWPRVKPEGQCLIVVPKDSPIKQLADPKAKIVMPEKVAYMTSSARRTAPQASTPTRRRHPRAANRKRGVLYQQRFRLHSGAARKWLKDGGTVLHRSVPQLHSPLIASRTLSAADIAAVQKAELRPTAEGQDRAQNHRHTGGL